MELRGSMKRNTVPDAPRTLIWRPSVIAVAATIGVLVLIWLLGTTPLDGSPNFGRSVARDYWWSRLAPASYARDLIGTTPAFGIVSYNRCSTPESRERAWYAVASGPRPDSAFLAIYAKGTTAARLYAVVGLAYLNSGTLKVALDNLLRDTARLAVADRITHTDSGQGWTSLVVIEERAVHEAEFPPARRARLTEFVTLERVREWAKVLARVGSRPCAT